MKNNRLLSKTQLDVLIKLNNPDEYLHFSEYTGISCSERLIHSQYFYFDTYSGHVAIATINSLKKRYFVKTIFLPATNEYKTIITDKGKEYLKSHNKDK